MSDTWWYIIYIITAILCVIGFAVGFVIGYRTDKDIEKIMRKK